MKYSDKLQQRIEKIKACDHELEPYAFYYGSAPTNVEMAGHCNKCGYDTHEDILGNCKEHAVKEENDE